MPSRVATAGEPALPQTAPSTHSAPTVGDMPTRSQSQPRVTDSTLAAPRATRRPPSRVARPPAGQARAPVRAVRCGTSATGAGHRRGTSPDRGTARHRRVPERESALLKHAGRGGHAEPPPGQVLIAAVKELQPAASISDDQRHGKEEVQVPQPQAAHPHRVEHRGLRLRTQGEPRGIRAGQRGQGAVRGHPGGPTAASASAGSHRPARRARAAAPAWGQCAGEQRPRDSPFDETGRATSGPPWQDRGRDEPPRLDPGRRCHP